MSYKVSDMILAKETAYIDLIIGGHTHAFLDNPVAETNKAGKQTPVTQASWELCFQQRKKCQTFQRPICNCEQTNNSGLIFFFNKMLGILSSCFRKNKA
jgi:hypothetical protein